MITKSIVIDHILHNHRLEDYLASKGIFPDSKGGSRKKYLCPLHDEKTPSFMIYEDEEGIQTYYCWGCKRSGNIITMKSHLEGLSFGKTLSSLGDGFDINDDEELDLIIKKMKEEAIEKSKPNNLKEMSLLSLNFGSLCYEHMKATDFDKDTIEFLEKLQKEFDAIFWRKDYDALLQFYEHIQNNRLFQKRLMKIEEIKKNLLRDRMNQLKESDSAWEM